VVGYSGDPDSGKQGPSFSVVAEEEATGARIVLYQSPEFAARPFGWDRPDGHPRNYSDPIRVNVSGGFRVDLERPCQLKILVQNNGRNMHLQGANGESCDLGMSVNVVETRAPGGWEGGYQPWHRREAPLPTSVFLAAFAAAYLSSDDAEGRGENSSRSGNHGGNVGIGSSGGGGKGPPVVGAFTRGAVLQVHRGTVNDTGSTHLVCSCSTFGRVACALTRARDGVRYQALRREVDRGGEVPPEAWANFEVVRLTKPHRPSALELLLGAAVSHAGSMAGKGRGASFLVDTTGDGKADHFLDAGTGRLLNVKFIDSNSDGHEDAIAVDMNGDGDFGGELDRFFPTSAEVVRLAGEPVPPTPQQSAGIPSGGSGGGLVTVRVTVPPGATAGANLEFSVHGKTLRVAVPPGARAGDSLEIRVPTTPAVAPAAAAPRAVPLHVGPRMKTVSVALPPGAVPGKAVKIQLGPGGPVCQITVPPGARPGTVLQLRIPYGS